MDKLLNITSNVTNNASNIISNIQNIPGKISERGLNTMNNLNKGKDFIKNNFTIYHYLVIIIIIIIIVYKVHKNKQYYKKNPTLISDAHNGRNRKNIKSDKLKNMRGKTEYSYTMWLYVDNMDFNFNKYKHVFTRGNSVLFDKINDDVVDVVDGTSTIKQLVAPGIWIDKIKNNIIFKISTTDPLDPESVNDLPVPAVPHSERLKDEYTCVISKQDNPSQNILKGYSTRKKTDCNEKDDQPIWGCDCFVIEDFPIRKWFCIGVTIKEREMELFFDGQLTFTGALKGPPKSMPTDIIVSGSADGADDGWAGAVKNIGCYSYALTPIEMRKIYYNGPNNRYYYLKWFYYIIDPINYLISSYNYKTLLNSASALKEEVTDLSGLELTNASNFNTKLFEKAKGLYAVGQRIFYEIDEELKAGYIQSGPHIDSTSPETSEVTYNIILEQQLDIIKDGSFDNVIRNVKQSKIKDKINSPVSSNKMIYLLLFLTVIIVSIVLYKKYS